MTDAQSAQTALDKLIEAVEAGTAGPVTAEAAFPASSTPAMRIFGKYLQGSQWIIRAHEGDLNAALALHEALLPGWIARVTTGAAAAGVKYSHCTVEDWDEGAEVDANNQPTPARAWLLAILRAYRSVQT